MALHPELLKRAEKAEADKQYIDAAVLFERAGEIERAIANYGRGGGVDRAVVLLEASGRGAQAAAMLVSVGQYQKAAALYEKLREFGKAASALLRANERDRAAAMYEKAEAFEDAAKIYASLGNHQRAIQLYAAAGNDAKVNELKGAHGSAEQAAAEGVLDLDPSMEIVADQYIDSDRLVGAVVSHLRAGKVADAARLYGNCQEDIGYGVLAAVAGDRAAEERAAEMFLSARDYAKAGQIFENLEAWPKGGEMYERADDPYMAAEMYVRAGDKVKAAEMFEKNGNHQQAAELYLAVEAYDKAAVNFERSVNHFVAGKLYFRMRKMEKSLQLLQKVQRSERQYFEACRMIGEILAAHGHLDLAIRKYLEVVQSAELSNDTAPVFYNLARTLESRGNVAQALSVYQRLLAWQFDFQDAAARAKALQAGGATSASPPAPAGAAPLPGAPSAATGADGASQPRLVSMMDGFEFLKGTPLFRDLSLDEMKAVYHACELRRFPAGSVIIEQDQAGAALYVLRAGTARVVKRSGDREEMVARMGPGSPAGEMSLIDDAPTSARVLAESDVDAFCITRQRFEKLVALDDRVAVKLYRFFVQTLSKRLRATSENLAKARGPY